MAYLLGGPSYSLHLHGDLPVYGRDHAQKMKNALFVAAAARPMQRQLIEQVGLPEHRTRTMLMGVDTSRFQPADASPRQGPLELITVSRLHHCKGHQHALSALRIALDAGANLRYTIVGEGPHAAAIREHIARLNLGSHVSMLGSRSEAEIKDLLRRSHAFLLTSVGLGEASPVAVMESMASAVPPICSIIGGTPDMISDAVDGLLVPQQDEQAIAAAIRRLHDDDHFRIALGRAARSRAESQFDSKVLAQRLISTIQELKGITH